MRTGMTTTMAAAQAMAIPKFAEGGIVTKPTLGLIGEAGPEAIIPLKDERATMGDVNITVNAEGSTGDMTELAESLGFQIEKELRYSRGI